MNNTKISIIVPIYNTEKYLKRCVDSLIAQTYTDIQIILVDDGSTDSSPEICDEYIKKDSRVVVIHKENGGLSSARNAGIDVADGEYIGFVDSDDYVSPDMYMDLITNIGDSVAAISNVMYVRVDENGAITSSKVPHTDNELISSVDFAGELMLHTGDVSVCTKLFHKSIFDGVRFAQGKLNEDLLFILDILTKIENIHFVGKVGYYYFTRSSSISSGYGKAVVDMVENSIIAMNFVKEKFSQLNEKAERFALYQHMAYLLLVPENLSSKENQVYINALKFIRQYTPRNLFNKYLNLKNKVVLCGLMIAPRLMSRKFKHKHGKQI